MCESTSWAACETAICCTTCGCDFAAAAALRIEVCANAAAQPSCTDEKRGEEEVRAFVSAVFLMKWGLDCERELLIPRGVKEREKHVPVLDDITRVGG